MLKLSTNLYNIPIISLRTGSRIGIAERPIINPNNLKIEGWYAQTVYAKGVHILPSNEIRELSSLGIAVNDYESITLPEELVRMKKVLEISFTITGKLVVTQSRKHLGRVEDFASDLDSFYIQRLYVRPPTLKVFTRDQLTIARQQIVEITDRKIIVEDIEITENAYFTAPAQVPEG